jgi:predicted Zn-ribbon and HTH transcriptional regulator
MGGSPKYDPGKDYYALLQVHPTAHPEVIKRAYRTIVHLQQAHPDLGGRHDEAVRLNEAYAVLTDPAARRAYDLARRTQGTALQCPHCGTRNRLPGDAVAARAVCGRCRRHLVAVPAPELPSADLPLSPVLAAALAQRGEVRLQRARIPVDGHLRCLRCRWVWRFAGAHLPAHCPRCHSRHWSEFRLFACQACGHRFVATDLAVWPYALFPQCPACHASHWHRGCEHHPLRWVINLLSA